MAHVARMLVLAAAVAAVAAAAGCGGRPQASVRYLAGNSDSDVTYDVAAYQLARDDKVQVILFRKVAAPIGTADPDFEYVFFEVPEASTYGWLREDNIPVYRWIHREGKNQVWKGTSGQIRESMSYDKTGMHFTFETTMEATAGTEGPPHILSGSIGMSEDITATQGLMNRYDEWLRSILGEKPRPKLPATVSKPKTASTDTSGTGSRGPKLGVEKPIK